MKVSISRTLFALAFITLLHCSSSSSHAQVRVHNLRATKANVQLKDASANTTNINDVEGAATSAYIEVAPGPYTVTAVIQNETVSPTATFTAVADESYTVTVATGVTPTITVIHE